MATPRTTATEAAAPRFSYLRDLWSRRDFIIHLARGNLEARNSEARLGRLWWLLNPLIMSGVYFFVFGFIITGTDRSKADFLAYLIIGVLVYRYLSQGLIDASKLIVSNEKLIVNIRFPRMVLPIAAVLESLVMFVASLGVFYLLVSPISCYQAATYTEPDHVAAATVDDTATETASAGSATSVEPEHDPPPVCVLPTWRVVFLPVPLILLGFFTLGVSSLVARWVVPIRDVRNLIPHVTRMWFYISPVLWDTDRIDHFEPWVQALIRSNPMYAFLSLFRFSLIGDPFESFALIQGAAWTVVAAMIGIWVFVRNEDDMARYL